MNVRPVRWAGALAALICGYFVCSAASAIPIAWDESIDGELNGDQLGSIDVGINTITGQSVQDLTCTFSGCTSFFPPDPDFFDFVVPVGIEVVDIRIDIGIAGQVFPGSLFGDFEISGESLFSSIEAPPQGGMTSFFPLTLGPGNFTAGFDPDVYPPSTFSVDAGEINYTWILEASAVPIPAAVWLFGSALGLAGYLRRRAG